MARHALAGRHVAAPRPRTPQPDVEAVGVDDLLAMLASGVRDLRG